MGLILFFILSFLSCSVLGHQTTKTPSQKEIRWNYSSIPIKVINNSSSLDEVDTLIDSSIAEWNAVSNVKLQKVFSSNNQIKFSHDFSIYGSAVIGVTEINYNSSGIINSAVITLNDQHYDFKDEPGMVEGNKIYLKDVLTHELGHFLGLSHTEVLDASMFYSTFPGQSEIAADDKAGIKNKYSSGDGKILGYIKGGSHIGVMGAHVQAISRLTGEAVSTISDENGYFEIGGLNLNDTYYLYISALKNLNALSGYYVNAQSEFCPGQYAGTFFSPCGRQNDGLPQGIPVTSSKPLVDVGMVSISCSLRSQQQYTWEKIQTDFTSFTLFDFGLEPRWEKAFVGFFKKSQLSQSEFSAPDKFEIDLSSLTSSEGKFLNVKLISQVFGNPLEYSMEIKQQGSSASGPWQKVVHPLNGIYKLDLSASLPLSSNSASNIFELEISAKKLTSASLSFSIPDGLNFSSENNLPYLLILSLNQGAGLIMDTGSTLSDNRSCLDAPFTYSVKKSTVFEDSVASSDSLSTDSAALAASCGTTGPGGSGPGSGRSDFFLLFSLGFLSSLLISKYAKRHKKILS